MVPPASGCRAIASIAAAIARPSASAGPIEPIATAITAPMMLRVLASMGPPVAWVDGMWCVRRLPTACSLALRRWLAAACGEVGAGGLTQCRADEYRRQHGEDVRLHQADQQ